MYKPKVPSYAVEDFNVHAFNFQSDMSLFTEFVVTIKADNPNENIGFVYGKNSLILVSYSDSDLCSGKLPAFYQPKKNVTEMSISLQGTSPFGSGLQEALMENRHTGRIPLLVRVWLLCNVMGSNWELERSCPKLARKIWFVDMP
ncbi:hypothetical protein CIPAW_04G124500 [Carya illinoinensis]|uniref:Late embryogenesis abundant protein LEA-2 subgroup domain-containing protein n=1 Tax=Carya illinoinensis TaxID=32201 RepID=A0A8T1QSJ2_CARIL|nr:hypothetical protein CIPAW_04G124500 [Carya illinoinensis]